MYMFRVESITLHAWITFCAQFPHDEMNCLLPERNLSHKYDTESSCFVESVNETFQRNQFTLMK